MIDPEVHTIGTILRDGVNTISLLASLATFITLSWIKYYRSHLFTRMSFRFQLLVAAMGIGRHLSISGVLVEDPLLCEIVAFSVTFFDQVYVLLNSYLALNTHIVFVHDYAPDFMFEYMYIVFSFLIAFTVDLHMFGFEQFGKNAHNICHYADTPERFITRVISLYIPMGPGVLYCGFVFMSVLRKLKSKVRTINIVSDASDLAKSNQMKKLEKLYFNISLYPLTCFVFFTPYLIGNFLLDYNFSLPVWFIYFYRLLIRLPGIVQLMILLQDPSFRPAFSYLYGTLRRTVLEGYRVLILRQPVSDYSTIFRPADDRAIFPDSELDDADSKAVWKVVYHDGDKSSLEDHIKYS